ncbi:MAG: hypothetical protein ACRD3Q_08050 [Terriglobales bacterium]
MTVTIPATDLQATQLNGAITALTTELSNIGTANGPLVGRITQQKTEAQNNLVLHLIGSGKLTAAGILSACTYGS